MDIAEHIRLDPESGTRRLLSEFGPGLYAVALHLVSNEPSAADDLYIRAMERAFERIAQFHGEGLFLWLRAILVSLRRMDLRRAGRRVPVVDDGIDLDSLSDETSEPLSEVLARSDADAVLAAVSRLPVRYREAVFLRYWSDLSVADVAGKLGIPVNTAKTHLARACALLRADLAPDFGKELPS